MPTKMVIVYTLWHFFSSSWNSTVWEILFFEEKEKYHLTEYWSLEFQGTYSKEKGVLVSVYVEKPKRRTFSNYRHHHHHHHHHHNNHHHIHHTIKRDVVHYRRGADGRGYISRRVELLQYSQHLRQSARSAPAAFTALNPRPDNTNRQQSHAQVPFLYLFLCGVCVCHN